MCITVRSIVIVAGLALALASGVAAGPGQPSFERVSAAHRGDPWSTDLCGHHRPMVGICRMLRPVRG
jgi:hypothetical protein